MDEQYRAATEWEEFSRTKDIYKNTTNYDPADVLEPFPPWSTIARPGTDAKVEVMRERADRQYQTCHPCDIGPKTREAEEYLRHVQYHPLTRSESSTASETPHDHAAIVADMNTWRMKNRKPTPTQRARWTA